MGRILIEFGDYKQMQTTNGVFASNALHAQDYSLTCASTGVVFGGLWQQLTTAIAALSTGPQTVNLTYSYIISGTTMDPGVSVTLEDKFAGPTNAQFKAEIDESLAEWKNVFETLFSRQNGYDNNLTMTFTDMGDETGNNFDSDPGQGIYVLPTTDNIGHLRFGMHNIDGPSGTVAHAYSPEVNSAISSVGGDVHFDDSEMWRLDAANTPGRISIKLVAVHEIGHAFGLGHPPNPFAVMFASVTSTQNFRTKFPNGLINGHAGAGSTGTGLEDACAIEARYTP